MPEPGLHQRGDGRLVYVIGVSWDAKTGDRNVLFHHGDASKVWHAPLKTWTSTPRPILHTPTDAERREMEEGR